MDAGPAGRGGVGIGLRQPHYAGWFDAPPDIGFVEVHSENFFADGGAPLGVLERVRETHAVSLHGVGLALGSAAGLDAWHLERLVRLAERIDPVRVSDHASFARAALPGFGAIVHGNDLLPIAFNADALAILARNVTQVQERLRRTILVENLSAYVSFAEATLAEADFFARLCRQTGCGMLLDLNNLMVNALNAGVDDPLGDCCAFVGALPPEIVGEIHLAGHARADGLVIDDHGSRVDAQVWSLYRHALRRLGARPTLIEWDTDLPALAVLLDEAECAARCIEALQAEPA